MSKSKLIFITMSIWFFILTGFMTSPHRSEAGDKEHFFVDGYCLDRNIDRYMFRDNFLIPYPYRCGHHYYRYFYHYPYNEKLPYKYYSRGYHNYYRHYYFYYPQVERSPYQDLYVRPAGDLYITVKPAKAKVFVDGYELEKGNDFSYTIGLFTGNHSVEVRAEGYNSYSQEVLIERGKEKVLSIDLTK